MSLSREILSSLGWTGEDREPKGEVEEVAPDIFELTQNTRGLRERLASGQKVILLVSGVSGGGKDSLVKELLTLRSAEDGFVKIKTCTTRKIRDNEIDDDPYSRLELDEFKLLEAKGAFIETEPYVEDWYGTRRDIVMEGLRSGQTPVFILNPKGCRTFLDKQIAGEPAFTEAALIYLFIIPENWQQLARRLLQREVYQAKSESEREKGREVVHKRWKQNSLDLESLVEAHFVMVNKEGEIANLAERLNNLITDWGKVSNT